MTFFRVLHAETLKMKRTSALKIVVLAPAVIVLLFLFLASPAPYSSLKRNAGGNKWMVLANAILRLWASLMMPLFIALETALVAGLDHSENQWKSLLARPVPRWNFYVTKLVAVMAMTAISTFVLVCGILIDGAILARVQTEVLFASPVPWVAIFRDCAQVAGL